MKYELAKKLYKDGTFKSPIPVTEANIKYIDYPPLSELIKACEKVKSIDFALFHWGNWVCGDRAEYEGDWITRAEGETPEEAFRLMKDYIENYFECALNIELDIPEASSYVKLAKAKTKNTTILIDVKVADGKVL